MSLFEQNNVLFDMCCKVTRRSNFVLFASLFLEYLIDCIMRDYLSEIVIKICIPFYLLASGSCTVTNYSKTLFLVEMIELNAFDS